MAAPTAILDTSELSRQIKTMIAEHQNAAAIVRIAQLLNTSEQVAAEWLVAKIAAYRGCSETEIAEALGVEMDQ